MTQRSAVDLLVIGADAAGMAAAACAARSGASAAIAATGGEAPAEGGTDEPPNFVWRLLDLHLHELRLQPAAPRTTLTETGALTTLADANRTGPALGVRDGALEHLWPAFSAEMKRAAASDAQNATDRYLPANALLDDYFSDEELKAHLVSAFVAPLGLAGDEAGSAAALAFAGDAPRRRVSARALHDALSAAAKNAGVDTLSGRLQSLIRTDGKHWKAVMDNGHELRARDVMASSALIGEAAGLRVSSNGSPLVRRQGAGAVIRIRYDKRPAAAALKDGGVFFTAGSRAGIARARDAMIDGRIDPEPALSFEVDGKEIIARAPFCPARIRDGDEERDWTGQDKQILGRQAASVIEQRLGGAVGTVREIEVTIGADPASGLKRRTFDMPAVPVPAPSHDPVGAAAALAMEIVSDD
jgi:hypothetical protein